MTAITQPIPEAKHDHITVTVHAGQDAIDTMVRIGKKIWQQLLWQQFMGISWRHPSPVPHIDELITKALLDLSPPGLVALLPARMTAAGRKNT